MARTRLLSLLQAELNAQRQAILDSMGSGACPDYPAYRDQCGYLRGLEAATVIIEELEADGTS